MEGGWRTRDWVPPSLSRGTDQAEGPGIETRPQFWAEHSQRLRSPPEPSSWKNPEPGLGRGRPLAVGPQGWEPRRAGQLQPLTHHILCISVLQAQDLIHLQSGSSQRRRHEVHPPCSSLPRSVVGHGYRAAGGDGAAAHTCPWATPASGSWSR